MRAALAALLAATLLAPSLAAQAPPSALARVRASGVLRVGIDATYPPFGIAEGGDLSLIHISEPTRPY